MVLIGNRKFAVAFPRLRFNMIRSVFDRFPMSSLSASCLITTLLVVAVFGVHLLADIRTSFSVPLGDQAADSTVTSAPSTMFGHDVNKSSTSSNSTPSSSDLTPPLLVNADHLCDGRDGDDANVTSLPLYLVIVHSRPDEVGQAQRDAIRATWGSNARNLVDGSRQQKPDIRIVFVVGRPSLAVPEVRRTLPVDAVHDPDIAKLRHESELYSDLVVADFIDAYRKLSVKSLIGMRWARTWCSSAKYIVKVDDDVFLFVDLLPEVMQRWRRLKGGVDRGVDGVDDVDKTDSLIGSLNVDAKVQRRGLWRVDRRTFSADRFPPYCSGNVYVMTSSAVDLLLVSAKADRQISGSNPFPLEDVYVTSMLAAKSGLRCRHDDAFPHWHVGPTGSNVKRMCARGLIAVHNVDYQRMYAVNGEMSSGGCYR